MIGEKYVKTSIRVCELRRNPAVCYTTLQIALQLQIVSTILVAIGSVTVAQLKMTLTYDKNNQFRRKGKLHRFRIAKHYLC